MIAVDCAVEALQLLAAEAAEQIAALPWFVVVSGEIALTLHDVLLLVSARYVSIDPNHP